MTLTVQFGRAVAQAVRRWLPTAAAQIRVWAARGVCGGQRGIGAGFLRVLRFPLPIIPPISPSSQSPGAGKIVHWWPQCRLDPIGLHPPIYQFKIIYITVQIFFLTLYKLERESERRGVESYSEACIRVFTTLKLNVFSMKQSTTCETSQTADSACVFLS
jgi:hypothetical protein